MITNNDYIILTYDYIIVSSSCSIIWSVILERKQNDAHYHVRTSTIKCMERLKVNKLNAALKTSSNLISISVKNDLKEFRLGWRNFGNAKFLRSSQKSTGSQLFLRWIKFRESYIISTSLSEVGPHNFMYRSKLFTNINILQFICKNKVVLYFFNLREHRFRATTKKPNGWAKFT